MRRNPTTLLAALVFTCGIVVAGCSSNDGAEVIPPPATSAPLSKADFVSQANDICTAAESQIIDFQKGDESSAPGNDRGDLLSEITPVAQRAIDDLRALTPPAEDAEMITTGIDRMQATLETAQTNPTAIIDPIGISGPELNAYGLTGCFSAGQPLDTTGTTAG